MRPMPIKSSGVLMEKGAAKLGLHAQVEPLAILSEPFNGRAPCINCGYCMYFGCEVGAKSSTLAAMIPLAEATGRCEIRPESVVIRIETRAGHGAGTPTSKLIEEYADVYAFMCQNLDVELPEGYGK